jgi:hypothetical protein
MEEEVNAFHRSRQHAGGYDDDHEQDEEHRHKQLGGFLYAFLYAFRHHDVGYQNEDNSPDGRFEWIGDKRLEICCHIVGIALQMTERRSEEILKTPTSHNGIESKDDHRREDANIASDGHRSAPSHLKIRPCRIRLSMTTDDELAYHSRYTKQKHASEIYQDECCSTVLTGHKGETPHVAQAHCRPCRGKDYTKLAAEIHSAFILHNDNF